MKRRVLVVDDEQHMVRTISDVLRRRGWEADGADSGEAAIEAVRAGEYDAVIMDIRMSGMNGVDAFREIRALRPRLPVVLMTAYSAHELLREAERLGVLRVFAKPFALNELTAALEGALRQHPSVLLVDDDPEFLSSIADILNRRGVPALLAGGLDEALRLLSEEHPGVVVLDLKMPGAEPRESVLAIQRLSPAVAIILCSGYPTLLEEAAAALPARWFRACLQKPFPPERLVEILDAIGA